MGYRFNLLVIFVVFICIHAFANDFYPLNHQQITKSQLDEMLPDEFRSLFTQPFVYKFNIYCDGWPDDGSTIIDFFLNQIPAKVIASLSSDDDFYSGIMINGHSVKSDEGWVDVSSYCNSKTLGVIVTPDFMLHSDASGTIWMGCSVSLGNKLEYDLIFHTIDNVSIYAYEVKTTVDIVTENFGYNPITYETLNELLFDDGATEFTNHFNQPYIARFELQSGSNIDQAVKIMMDLQQAPLQAIGRGSGENAPQAAIGVEFTKQHNIKTDGFEDIYQYCNTNELYMILNDDPVLYTPGHMILWMGFYSQPGYWLTYQNMPNCLKPEVFSITAYRFTDQIVTDVSVISPENYELAYLQIGDNYYIDRNYYITNIPDTLKDLIWLKTANDDKKNSSNSYITLNLQNNATVYVAYDHRAVVFPDWLIQNFQRTNKQILVSDAASPLILWQKDVSVGNVTLGGNLANEASGAKSNYIVLVENEKYASPAALFDFGPKEGVVPLEVSFQDNSTGDITSWNWDFGDGSDSDQQNPTHIYQTAGKFTITLKVTGPGGSDTKTASVSVYEDQPVAEFTADITAGTKPLTVQFTDNSTGQITSWEWDFGDGATGASQNPVHVYQNAGLYTVNLKVIGPGGMDTETKVDYIRVLETVPVANFNAEPTSGACPLTVQFTDISTGPITSREWDFGDGASGSSQNPEHIYQNSGLYAVGLTVTGPGGSDTEIKVDCITATEAAPIANFGAEPTAGTKPLTVQFTDQSSGTITEWFWNFGDGYMSSTQNPVHQYETADTFTVSLKVTGPGGSYTKIKENFINVSNPTLISELDPEIPEKFYLLPNFPNPFNSNTCIRFGLSRSCYTELCVYNMSGQLIEKLNAQSLSAGNYTFTWDASPYPSGVYLCKIIADDFYAVRKMLYIK